MSKSQQKQKNAGHLSKQQASRRPHVQHSRDLPIPQAHELRFIRNSMFTEECAICGSMIDAGDPRYRLPTLPPAKYSHQLCWERRLAPSYVDAMDRRLPGSFGTGKRQ